MQKVRMTTPTRMVLKAFLENQDRELTGGDIWELTRLAAGSRYPLMIRLELRGLLTSRWEDVDPSVVGRPRRRFYKLTESGAAWAAIAVAKENKR